MLHSAFGSSFNLLLLYFARIVTSQAQLRQDQEEYQKQVRKQKVKDKISEYQAMLPAANYIQVRGDIEQYDN